LMWVCMTKDECAQSLHTWEQDLLASSRNAAASSTANHPHLVDGCLHMDASLSTHQTSKRRIVSGPQHRCSECPSFGISLTSEDIVRVLTSLLGLLFVCLAIVNKDIQIMFTSIALMIDCALILHYEMPKGARGTQLTVYY
jgi:hypothetical protein